MYKLSVTVLALSLVVWGCTAASRERWKHVFFEIPQDEKDSQSADATPAEPAPPLALRTAFSVDPPGKRFASSHPPFVTRDCAKCHNAADRMSERDDLLTNCKSCHADFFAETVEHFPVKEGQCFECHDPHRSERDHLLTMSVLDGCIQCHDPPEDLSQPVHGVSGVEDCTACHDPHFGAVPMLKPNPSITIPADSTEDQADENENSEE